MHIQLERGFSLVELITVMVLVGIISTVVASRMMPNTTLQLQAGRDDIVAAFYVAQQRAMAQTQAIEFSSNSSANSIDIRQDSNGDGAFSESESILASGTQYPLSLPSGVQVSNSSFNFDRLGRTTAATINLNSASESISISVSVNGYVE